MLNNRIYTVSFHASSRTLGMAFPLHPTFLFLKKCKGKNFPRSLIKGRIKVMKMREYAKCKQNFLVERCKCIRSYMEYDTNCTS